MDGLREAVALVEAFMPESPDKVDCLRRMGLAVSSLEKPTATALCRRCQQPFTVAVAWFIEKQLHLPTHCDACRQVRRVERRQRETRAMAARHAARE